MAFRRLLPLLTLTVALTSGAGAFAASKRQPYDVPRLTPRYGAGAMSKSEPWKLKEPNAYRIRQPADPYTTKRSRAHVAAQVRAYDRGLASQAYTPPKSPRMKRQPRIDGVCYVSSCD